MKLQEDATLRRKQQSGDLKDKGVQNHYLATMVLLNEQDLDLGQKCIASLVLNFGKGAMTDLLHS